MNKLNSKILLIIVFLSLVLMAILYTATTIKIERPATKPGTVTTFENVNIPIQGSSPVLQGGSL